MQHEEESVELVKQLKPPEAALLNWADGLMADVVEEEDSNKKTAGNIAMDYAPNMTQVYFHYFLAYESCFSLQWNEGTSAKSEKYNVALHVRLMVHSVY